MVTNNNLQNSNSTEGQGGNQEQKIFESFLEIAERDPELIPGSVLLQTDPFATALAHEVRNPLTNINLAAEMLSFTGFSDEQKSYLSIITRNSDRINGIMTELLTSKQENEAPLEKSSLRQILDEVLKVNEDRIILKN